MVYVLLMSILLTIIVVTIWFKNLLSIVSLLTAISTLLLGIYQLSKDIKRIDFNIQLFRLPFNKPAIETHGILTITNVGFRPVYFQNFSILPRVEQAIIIYSEFEKYSLHKIFLNKFSRKFSHKEWFNTGDSKFIPIKKSDHKKTQFQRDSSFVVKGGELIQVPFTHENKEGFFKRAKRLYIMDANSKKYYMENHKIRKIKEELNR